MYSTRLWWDSSVSSSTRMPVSRRTSTAAQAQKALSSSRVRSRRLPLAGSSTQIRGVGALITSRRSRWPARGELLAGLSLRRHRQPLGGLPARRSTLAINTGEHRDALTSALVHAGLAVAAFLSGANVVDTHRTRNRPLRPPRGVLGGPVGDVEVEGADRGGSSPRPCAASPPVGPAESESVGSSSGCVASRPRPRRGQDAARRCQGDGSPSPSRTAAQVTRHGRQRGEVNAGLAFASGTRPAGRGRVGRSGRSGR